MEVERKLSTVSFRWFVESVSVEIRIIRATVNVCVNSTLELYDSGNTSVSDFRIWTGDGNDSRFRIHRLNCVCTLEALNSIHVVSVRLTVTILVSWVLVWFQSVEIEDFNPDRILAVFKGGTIQLPVFDETLVLDAIRIVIDIEPLGEPLTFVVVRSSSYGWSRGRGIEVVCTFSGVKIKRFWIGPFFNTLKL